LNRLHMAQRNGVPQLESGIQAMEIAYRMQTEAPEVFDLQKESKPPWTTMGRTCPRLSHGPKAREGASGWCKST
jgi:hypothetical protein